jgi:uridylate kinase
VKLSGEALMGGADYGIDPAVLKRIAGELQEIVGLGVQLAVVIGGGNIFRGAGLAAAGMDRVTGDHMGMLATVMNALAMQDAIEKRGGFARVMSAIQIHDVAEDFIRRRAIRHIEKGRIVLFAAGTGNPFFTTDSAAALRAVEVGADLLLKATKVDGVYTADPAKYSDAKRFEQLTYDQVIERKLAVMDTAAIALCRDHRMPLRIYDMTVPGSLMRIMRGEAIGTLVDAS